MERRSALRNMLLAMGYTVSMPTVVSVLQSCENPASEPWKPLFLTEVEKMLVEQIADIIIPKTDIVGAIDVGVPILIDALYHEVESEESREIFRKGAAIFAFNFGELYKKNVVEGTREQFEIILGNYFNLAASEEALLKKNQSMNYKEVPLKGMERYLVYKFLLSVRQKTLLGYYTCEKVGEEILAYDQIPGNYIPCGDLNEITGGKAWSLS